MTRSCPLTVQTIRGTPLEVRGHHLVPVVRVLSVRKHRALIAPTGVRASGWGALYAQPLKVIETRESAERAIPVSDTTAKVLARLAIIALVTALASIVLIIANQRAET